MMDNVRLPVKIGRVVDIKIQELEAIGYKRIMGVDAFCIARNKIIKIYRNTKFRGESSCVDSVIKSCTLIRNYEKVYGDEDTPRRIVIKEHFVSFDEFDELTSCQTAEEKFMIEAFNYYQFKGYIGNVPAHYIPHIDKAGVMRNVLSTKNQNWVQLSTWNALTGDYEYYHNTVYHEPFNEYFIYGEA